MVRVSSPAKLRPWSGLTAKMVMGVVSRTLRKPFKKVSKSVSSCVFRVGFWQNGFFADFYFWAAGFFRGFLAGFFLLIFVGKSAQKNPPGKSPQKSSKIYTTKILRHISAEWLGQVFPFSPKRRATHKQNMIPTHSRDNPE